jgi:hypothetical protein
MDRAQVEVHGGRGGNGCVSFEGQHLVSFTVNWSFLVNVYDDFRFLYE